MKGPTFIFFGVLLIVLVSVAALSIILMRQLFPIYKKPQIMRIFYLLTSVSIFALFLGRGWLDKLPFAGDLMLFIVIWFVSLTFLIVFSPAAFVVKKIIIQTITRNYLFSESLKVPLLLFTIYIPFE